MAEVARRPEKIIYFFLSLSLFVYVILRAHFVPLIYDENTTFHAFIETGQFTPFFSEWSANNHFLNSALAAAFYGIFGADPLILRLPNVLSFLLYALFTWRISTLLRSAALRWFFISLMLMANGLMEYFSLARGYGLSMAFLTASVYYLLRAATTNNLGYYLGVIFMSTLATISNYTLVITQLIILSLLALFFLRPGRKNGKRKWILPAFYFLMGVMPLALVVMVLKGLQSQEMLYYGKEGSFWQDTVNSLFDLVLIYPSSFWKIFLSSWLLIITVGLPLLHFRKRLKDILSMPETIFFILLAGNAAAHGILNSFFGVKLPLWRTGLFYLPIFFGLVSTFNDRMLVRFQGARFLPLLMVPFLLIPVNFLSQLNLSTLKTHPWEIFPERFHRFIVTREEAPDLTVSGDYLHLGEWEFLNYSKDGPAVHFQTSNFRDNLTDFQIRHNRFMDDSVKLNYFSVMKDEPTGTYLLERKSKIREGKVIHRQDVHFRQYITDNRHALLGLDLKPYRDVVMFIKFNLQIECPTAPFIASIVTSVADTAGNELIREEMRLNYIKRNWSGSGGALTAELTLLIPETAGTLEITFINYKWVRYRIPEGMIIVTETGDGI